MIEQRLLELEKPVLLVDQFLALDAPQAVEAATENEPHHLMQLAPIEKRPVPSAHVDDGAGEAGEVEPVHQLFAARAWPVVNGRRGLLTRRGICGSSLAMLAATRSM